MFQAFRNKKLSVDQIERLYLNFGGFMQLVASLTTLLALGWTLSSQASLLRPVPMADDGSRMERSGQADALMFSPQLMTESVFFERARPPSQAVPVQIAENKVVPPAVVTEAEPTIRSNQGIAAQKSAPKQTAVKAADAPTPAAREEKGCIRNAEELNVAPKVDALVDKMGGLRALQGRWQIGGLASIASSATIIFQSRADGLKAKVEGVDGVPTGFASIMACASNRDPRLLEIHVLAAGSEKILSTILVKPGEAPGTLEIAKATDRKFYSFVRAETSSSYGHRSVASFGQQ
jgi:hypothetical protein